ncbi:MAG: serine/threonine protein kinase [Phycisphaerales bacterium]|nr:serine/threonine protein kinase [Phycisphaerales bacterium]
MGEPRDISRARISPDAARRVLVAIDDARGHAGAEPRWPRIDGYIIERELGRGAGGVTYLARKTGSEAKIALKVLHSRPGDGRASQRAWRELDTLQQVRVPSVPRLLDFGTTDHSLYIATEYIEGTPLSELYAHARPADLAEMRERVRLLEKIARAAHSLHERGVIHRDLKPSNVIVAPAATNGADDKPGVAAGKAGDGASSVGEPFIIDLGIALIDAPDLHQTLTQDGQPVGTPAFMAPEQARGRREEISTRSDIYSLGAIGYWLCTGETPHDLTGATLHEAIRRVGSEPAREARGISKAVPKGLGAVLGKACGRKAADRYGSAVELADDLDRWRGREFVHAKAPGLWPRTTSWMARHPIAVTVLLCATLMIGTLAINSASLWWLRKQPDRITLFDSAASCMVTVEPIAGPPIFSWEGPSGAYSAALASRSPSTHALTYAVLAHNERDDSRQRGQLCWYAVDRYSNPEVVHGPAVPGAVGPPEPTVAMFAAQADVFPQVPGTEVIAIHRGERRSHSAIAVYAWNGVSLSTVWYDGHLDAVRYYPAAGLLVCAGINSEHEWSDYGLPQGPRFVHPEVVFAFRPSLEQQGDVLTLCTTEDVDTAWSFVFYPPSMGDLFSLTSMALASNPPLQRRDVTVRVDLEARAESRHHISWLITTDGVVEAIDPDDAFKSTPALPPADSVSLVPFCELLDDLRRLPLTDE